MLKPGKTTKIEVSFRNIAMTVFFLIGLYVLYLIRDILIGLFISILFATALNPVVSRLQKLRIPRTFAAALVYVMILSSIVLLITVITPPLISQTNTLIEALPINPISNNLQRLEINLDNLQSLTTQLGSVIPILKIASSTFSGLVTVFTFAVITFYLLVERNELYKYLAQVIQGENPEEKAKRIIEKVEDQIGGWVRGQMALMLIVGIITYIGLTLLNVPYAMALAILAGALEIVPNIGPTLSAVPAIFVPLILGGDPLTAVFVLALYILVQQIENNFIVPKVMQSAVGVHPLVTILLIIIGLKLAGIAGAVLAVPMFLVAKVFYVEIGKAYIDPN